MRISKCVFVLGVFAMSFTASNVRAQHSDVEIAIENGQVEVHERIAEGEFGSDSNPANETDDPGFAPEGAEDTPATTTFAADQQVSFQTVDLGTSGLNLWYWDGSGSPSFGASPHDLTISKGVLGSVSLSAGNGGFTMFDASAANAPEGPGFFDDHLDFVLNVTNPDAGVYVFGMTLGSPNASPAVLDSEPVYFVMASQGLDESIHEAAIGYVETSLVPEPGSQWMLLVGMLSIVGLRCRQARSRS